MERLRELRDAHPELFGSAVRELPAAVDALEQVAGIRLPASVRWFWLECGSGLSGAAPSVAMAAEATQRYRTAVALPETFVVLDDRGDAGTVFLNTASPSGSVLWVDSHAVAKVAEATLSANEFDQFEEFSDWVAYCVEEARDAP